MRGYADFIYGYTTKSIKPDDKTTVQDSDTSDFSTAADVDFLFDFSPITAELHFNATNSNKVSGTTKDSFGNDLNTTGSSGGVGLEQAFARYNFNRDFHITFGRQLTSLGFDDDEAPGLYTTSATYANAGSLSDINAHQNYNDGIRANFNNGRFGFILGLYDGYWTNGDFNSDKVESTLSAS